MFEAILDIEKVVIGGGISAQPLLVKTIQKQYDQLFEEMGFFGKMLHKVKSEGLRLLKQRKFDRCTLVF